jgi:hypothetical protein
LIGWIGIYQDKLSRGIIALHGKSSIEAETSIGQLYVWERDDTVRWCNGWCSIVNTITVADTDGRRASAPSDILKAKANIVADSHGRIKSIRYDDLPRRSAKRAVDANAVKHKCKDTVHWNGRVKGSGAIQKQGGISPKWSYDGWYGIVIKREILK